jgi:hypothetical protein
MSLVKNLEPVGRNRYATFDITHVRFRKNADVIFENTDELSSAEQMYYTIHVKGLAFAYGPDGEQFARREAGNTTDTDFVQWPIGLITLKAQTDEYEYLCVTKHNQSRVNREEHHLTDGQELTITNDTEVLAVISGVVRLNGLDITGPEIVEIKSPSVRLVSVGNSFVSKIS